MGQNAPRPGTRRAASAPRYITSHSRSPAPSSWRRPGGTLELDRHFSLFSRSYSIDSLGWEVEGDFFGVDYAITKGGQTVARMEKAWPAFHDRYRLEIADPADAMAALCTVLAIDCCDEHHQN